LQTPIKFRRLSIFRNPNQQGATVVSAVFRRASIGIRGLAFVVMLVAAQTASAAKNVIIMVSDGAGCNTWLATSMYQGKVGKQVYDRPGWQHYLASTFPLNMSPRPTGTNTQDPALVYVPAKFWDCAPLTAASGPGFAGYLFATRAATDSAAAATALSTGVKTFNFSVNWSDDDKAMRGQTVAELAKSHGKGVGVVTTVLWCDATPVGLGGAHNADRSAYAALANELLDSPCLDVLMGAGHPCFDDNGEAMTTKTPDKQWAYVGGQETWDLLKAGKHPAGWKLIETKAEFDVLANSSSPPTKVLGTAQVACTLQCNRSNGSLAERRARGKPVLTGGRGFAEENNDRSLKPFQTPLNESVPSLAEMTRGAIHCLENNPNGLFLMIEGGAVDWANHGNNAGRMIEEHIDFLGAVDAVVQWVETHGGWDETLLILTADHETGFLWGPQSDTTPFQPLVDRGAGNAPGLRYNSTGHTNSLTPLFARGAGSERFAELVRGIDETAAKVYSVSGRFVDNTDISKVMKEALGEPRRR
jgi:alkaline phosphatase